MCSTEMCRTNSTVTMQQCVLDCCDSPLCLQLNASSYGNCPQGPRWWSEGLRLILLHRRETGGQNPMAEGWPWLHCHVSSALGLSLLPSWGEGKEWPSSSGCSVSRTGESVLVCGCGGLCAGCVLGAVSQGFLCVCR